MPDSSDHNRLLQPSVLLLDVAQQSNAGDDIMQRALISLLREHVSENLAVTAYFGCNEFAKVEKEFISYREKYDIEVGGGVARTYYIKRKQSKYIDTLIRLMYLAHMFLFILLIKLGLSENLSGWVLNRRQKEAFENIVNADLVVWNGRNFRGGRGRFAELVKICELCLNPLICMVLGKPVYCVGASVWPLKCALSRFAIKYVARHSNKFWVRESSSFAYMTNELGLEQASVSKMPDLSFYILHQILSDNTDYIPDRSSNVLALTLVGRKEFASSETHARYMESYADLVCFAHDHGFKIRIIPQVTYDEEPYDAEIKYISAQHPDVDIEIIPAKSDVEGLLSEYCQCRALVASRMHSAIFASACGLPVAAVSYDSGAKWAILNDIPVPDELVVDADKVTGERLIANFKALVASDPAYNGVKLSEFASECEDVFRQIITNFNGRQR